VIFEHKFTIPVKLFLSCTDRGNSLIKSPKLMSAILSKINFRIYTTAAAAVNAKAGLSSKPLSRLVTLTIPYFPEGITTQFLPTASVCVNVEVLGAGV
jgi:hypothetical protein